MADDTGLGHFGFGGNAQIGQGRIDQAGRTMFCKGEFGVTVNFAPPGAHTLMDRFGPKRVTLVGLALVVAAMVSSYGISELWQLNLLWGVLSGLGTGMVGGVLGPAVANRWFIARRCLVIGIFGASLSAGQLVFVPLLMTVVLNNGWRWSSRPISAWASRLLRCFVLSDAPSCDSTRWATISRCFPTCV